jgi:minor extracellular serine protease Vpr
VFQQEGDNDMRKRLIPIPFLIAALTLLSPPVLSYRLKAQSARHSSDEAGLSRLLNTYSRMRAIIELTGEPVIAHEVRKAQGGQLDARVDIQHVDAQAHDSLIQRQQEEFKTRAAVISPEMRTVTQLTKLANAVSIEAAGIELAQMAMLPDVRRLEIVREVYGLLDASVPLIGAPALWERVGGSSIAGQGVKIAVIDSGVDISNPMFSDEGMIAPAGYPRGELAFTNNKVIVAKSFLGANSTPSDENGHGTAVAAIAAGSLNVSTPLGTLSGVAPRAFVGNYRVLDKDGRGRDDLFARALEEALNDGFDIANISLGHDSFAGSDFISRVVEEAITAGIVVVVAAGNSGENGLSTITSPGIAPSAITVGAITNSHTIAPVVGVEGPQPVPTHLAAIGATLGVGGPNAFGSAIGPMSYEDVSSIDGSGRACGVLTSGSLSGKAGLIERGDCTFASKVNVAESAGATAAIVFNRDAGTVADGGEALVLMDVKETRIPSVFIGRSGGLALREWLTQNPGASLRISPAGALASTADVIAPFSSRGPTFGQVLKPDIVAPGVSIYSAAIKQPNERGITDASGFKAESGTSQATPHVSGAAALLKQLYPSFTPAQIKSALVNSATGSVFTNSDRTTRAGLFETGAGRLDLARAMKVSATISPSNLSFGTKILKKKALTLTSDLKITNVADTTVAFTTDIELFETGTGVSASSSNSSVTLARGEAGTIRITIQAAKKAERRTYTGTVNLVDSSGLALRVPFWVRFVKKQ